MSSSGVVDKRALYRANARACADNVHQKRLRENIGEDEKTFCIRCRSLRRMIKWSRAQHEIGVQRQRRDPVCMVSQRMKKLSLQSKVKDLSTHTRIATVGNLYPVSVPNLDTPVAARRVQDAFSI